MVEAIRLGAVGLLAEDGALHRMTAPPAAMQAIGPAAEPSAESAQIVPDLAGSEGAGSEPLLSADELRALLQENPASPPEHE
jgi:hypothetical protein